MSGNARDVSAALQSYLTSRSLTPTQGWLDSFIASARLSTPLPALQKTALFRLLASDISTSLELSSASLLPSTATSVDIKTQRLPGKVAVQVLDIEDIGRSRWSQVELLEQQERGEMTKGREIIRLAPDAEAEQDLQQTPQVLKSSGPHKLLIQDASGSKIYGFELLSIKDIGVQMSIGTKLLLKNAVIARGVVLLDPQTVEVLGGKIEAWDKAWRTGRKETLKQRIPT